MQVLIIGIIFLSFVVGILGRKTRMGFWGNFILSLFLTPLVPLLVIFLTSDFEKQQIRMFSKKRPIESKHLKFKEFVESEEN